MLLASVAGLAGLGFAALWLRPAPPAPPPIPQVTSPTVEPAAQADDDDHDAEDEPHKRARHRAKAAPPTLAAAAGTWAGVYTGDKALLRLAQRGARVRGLSLVSGVIYQVRATARGTSLSGTATAAGLAPVPFTATLHGAQMTVRFQDGSSGVLARVPVTGKLPPVEDMFED